MAHIDIFNGDADGLCALLQLRLAEPRDSRLVTGIKRDIQLLARVEAEPDDQLTVLDISMQPNRADLDRLLAAGARVFYCDHHACGEPPAHPRLTTLINLNPEASTSALINTQLQGAFAAWAVVGACGDNQHASATAIAKQLGLDSAQFELLERLGTCLNYNAYGSTEADLHFPPAALYRRLHNYANPLDFIADDRQTFERLAGGYRDDMQQAAAIAALCSSADSAVFLLPDSAWARRVSGVFGNRLATDSPQRAHAVLSHHPAGGYVISVRAPMARRRGAGALCARFPNGGGREAAAGINQLPEARLAEFIEAFSDFYAR